MTRGIRNEKYFCQKLYSGGVGRTFGGDIDNFYSSKSGDRYVFWEAKHKNADRDIDCPQSYYLKRLVNCMINEEVRLVWVEHECEESIVQLKDCVPFACYYKPAGSARGTYQELRAGTTVNDIADWVDGKKEL